SQLTATGITKCGDYVYSFSGNSNNELDCWKTIDSDGDPVPAGQDGHYQTGKTMSYTVLTQGGDTCVKDNVTGLIWEQKTNDGGLRDRNNTYSWYNPDSSINGGSAGYKNEGRCSGSDCDTYAYINALNASNYCSYSDWRMPTHSELVSLLDGSPRYTELINRTVFPHTIGWYWTSSPHADESAGDGTSVAWFVDFNNGTVLHDYRFKAHYVRAVRASE
ncbi:MAG: hypothetical protein CSA49_07505, partial [Gammaproteobacteria bacterium]